MAKEARTAQFGGDKNQGADKILSKMETVTRGQLFILFYDSHSALVMNNELFYIYTTEDGGLEGDDTEKRCSAVADTQLSLFPVQLYS